MKAKRNLTIDFFRGIAVFSIIFIHTCFWSGTSYTPEYLKSISLILDVPFFVVISGMCFNFNGSIEKTIKGLVKFWKKYLIFVIIFFVLLFFLDKENFTIKNLISSIFFRPPEDTVLRVVAGSMWFIFMFFPVSIISSIIITLYNKKFKNLESFKYVLIFIFILYGMSIVTIHQQFLNSQYLMYILLFLLGYYIYHYKLNFKLFIILEIINGFLFYLIIRGGLYTFTDMQIAKFDYHFFYFLYSMFLILLLIYLKDKLIIKKKNLFTFLGKNAFMLYLSQGIGASLIYYLYKYISSLKFIYKFGIMFISNCVITIGFSIIITFIINKVESINFKNIYNKHIKKIFKLEFKKNSL